MGQDPEVLPLLKSRLKKSTNKEFILMLRAIQVKEGLNNELSYLCKLKPGTNTKVLLSPL